MVAELDALEAHLEVAPPLMARQYRQLWLDSEHELGQVAETLAAALGWQPTEADPLPNALELAEAAAERILQLQAQAVFATLTHRQLDSNLGYLRTRKKSCNVYVAS